MSARYYSKWDLMEPLIEARSIKGEDLPPQVMECRTVFYTPVVANTPRIVENGISRVRWSFGLAVERATWAQAASEKNQEVECDPDRFTELLIVDEVDRLKMAGLEVVRDTYDRGHMGLVLIGMPGIEKRLARYPQFYSRVGFVHEFKPLSTAELNFILQHKWEQLGLSLKPDDFTDAEAISAVIRITNGNFRLIHRLFAQIERILQINSLHTVTKEVVETARQSLVIGTM